MYFYPSVYNNVSKRKMWRKKTNNFSADAKKRNICDCVRRRDNLLWKNYIIMFLLCQYFTEKIFFCHWFYAWYGENERLRKFWRSQIYIHLVVFDRFCQKITYLIIFSVLYFTPFPLRNQLIWKKFRSSKFDGIWQSSTIFDKQACDRDTLRRKTAEIVR